MQHPPACLDLCRKLEPQQKAAGRLKSSAELNCAVRVQAAYLEVLHKLLRSTQQSDTLVLLGPANFTSLFALGGRRSKDCRRPSS